MSFNTGNPLGSKDILDLYDNSEVVDQFVNSQQDEIPDRFGTKRLTLAGLIKRSMALRNEINDFSGAMTFKPEWTDVPMNVSEGVGGEGGALNLQAEALGNRSEINKITSREALRRTYLEAGLNLVSGSFEAGGTLVNANDVLLHEADGTAYNWDGVFPGGGKAVPPGATPASTGGVVGGAWRPVGDITLREELASPGGSNTVGFQQEGDGSVPRTQQDKHRDIVHSKDFGAVGSGDETTQIQNALNAAVGKILLLDGTKTYTVTSVSIPDNVTLETGGAVFRRESGSGYIVTVGANVTADIISVSDIGGASNVGVHIAGSNTTIGRILAKSDDLASLYGVRIEGAARLGSLNVGSISTENYRSAVQCFNVIASSIGRIVMNRIAIGLYLRDVKNTKFDSVYSALLSPASTGRNGENGILIESATAAYSTEGVTFGNVEVQDTAEHGVRLGGSFPMRNIHFDSITTLNTGAANGIGGAGFKILGYETSPGVFAYHEDITVGDLSVTDVSLSAGVNNFSGIVLGNVKGLNIGSYLLKKRNHAASAKNAIFINNCQNVTINGVKASDVERTGLLVTTDSSVQTSELVKNIVIRGEIDSLSPTANVIYFQTAALTVDGFTFDGTLRKGGAAIRSDAATGAAYRKGIRINAVYLEPLNIAAGPPIQCNNYPEEIVVDFTGPYYGTFGSGCCNGSIFRDPAGGANAIRIRKNGGWTIL